MRRGMHRSQLEQPVERARREETRAAHLGPEHDVVIVAQLPQRRARLGLRYGETVDDAGDLSRGGNDRTVAGATAEIAGERLMHRIIAARLAAMLEGEERHDEAWRAEAALARILLDHRGLNRVE